MKLYAGEDLQHLLQVSDKKFQYRDQKAAMDSYLSSDDPRILCLYGIRRTGKTTLMLQCLRTLSVEQSLYVICHDGDSFYDLDQILSKKEFRGKKYLFLDEVTRLNGFLNAASLLYDAYSSIDRRVVMTGTDSLGFSLIRSGELFDRAVLLPTTQIPFFEYHRLLGKSILDYIRYGGTLTDGRTLYNDDPYRGNYTNSAIVENITNSLKKYKNGAEYDLLRSMVSNGDLSSAIRKILEAHNERFLQLTINESFRSHDLGSLSDLLTRHRINPKPIQKISEEADTAVRPYLFIKRDINWVSEEAVQQLEYYLEVLDVVVHDTASTPDRFLFTIPGMRYAQCEEEAEALLSSAAFQAYTEPERELVLKKLEQDITGQILEDVVFLQCRDTVQKPAKVRKIRSRDGHEIDVLVTDPNRGTAAALEVKLSDQRVPDQWNHLRDTAFLRSVEQQTGCRIQNKAVLYLGPDTEGYRNAEEFLLHPEQELERLLTDPGYMKEPDFSRDSVRHRE